MIGPEHYREAERLLQTVQRATYADDALILATAAQAHATLALAAATALSTPEQDGMSIDDYEPWVQAASAEADTTDRSDS